MTSKLQSKTFTVPSWVCKFTCKTIHEGKDDCDHLWKTWSTDIDFYAECVKCKWKYGFEVYD